MGRAHPEEADSVNDVLWTDVAPRDEAAGQPGYSPAGYRPSACCVQKDKLPS